MRQSGTPEGQSSERERRLEELLGEWLEAREAGQDRSTELLERAGDLAPQLEERLRIERELRALRHELGLGGASGPPLVGRFRPLEVLGRGGSSVVHLAYDPKLERRIALKVLRENLGPDERTWILNEARALAKLDHPNVVRVHEVGENDSRPFVAMELLTGPSLREVLCEWTRQRSGAGDPGPPSARALALRLASYTERLRCLIQLARALSYCHDHGVLHRDIKPENVLFDATGTPKLIDFGLAHDAGADEDSKLNLTQSLVGTPAYIAPEQVANSRVGADPRSDQFTFATLVYECFALENPFLRQDRRGTLDAVEAALPPPLAARAPAVPPDLAVVVRHAHDRDPQMRYPDLAVMASDLQAVLEHRAISARAPTLLHRTRLWARRHHRGVRGASAAFLLALALWCALTSIQTTTSRTRLIAELHSIRPGEFQEQADFYEAYEPLKQLQEPALAFDASFLRSVLWGAVGPEIEEVVLQWSHGLHDLFAEETEERRSAGQPPPEGLFPRLFLFDSILCPNAPWNEAARKRGTVRIVTAGLPETRHDHYKYRVRPISRPVISLGFQEFRWNPRPEFGTYLVLAVDPRDDSVLGETVLFVPQGWFPEIVREIHAPRAELLATALRVAGGQVPIDEQGAVIEVLPFSILAQLVTREEFDRFRAATGGTPLQGAARIAGVCYDEAMAYAAWAGGRLPTRAELDLAEMRGVVPSTDTLEGSCGEYLLDIHPLPAESPGWLNYETGTMNLAERSMPTSAEDLGSLVGFRIVFSSARAGDYHRLARTP